MASDLPSAVEGPQIYWYANDLLPPLVGRRVVRVGGDRAEACSEFRGLVFDRFVAAGKLLLIHFVDHPNVLRIHCLMFGDVRLNRTRPGKRLTLRLTLDGPAPADKLYVFLGSARPECLADLGHLDAARRGDALQPSYDGAAVLAEASKQQPDRPLTDVLLDQSWFPGLGNKIKTEALWLAKLHPLMPVGRLTAAQRRDLSGRIADYSQTFLQAVHEQGDHCYPPPFVFRRKRCPECGATIETAQLGEPPRKSHWCPSRQPAPSV